MKNHSNQKTSISILICALGAFIFLFPDAPYSQEFPEEPLQTICYGNRPMLVPLSTADNLVENAAATRGPCPDSLDKDAVTMCFRGGKRFNTVKVSPSAVPSLLKTPYFVLGPCDSGKVKK